MHSEFNVSEKIEIKHRAGCVWQMLIVIGKVEDKRFVERECRSYGISYANAMKWKKHWLSLMKK